MYLQFSKSSFLFAMSSVVAGFIDACVEDNEKLCFSLSFKVSIWFMILNVVVPLT